MPKRHASPDQPAKAAAQDDIPAAELEVLAGLWRRGRGTVREVREDIASFRPMTHGAAMALFRRLERKGLIERTSEKVGKAHVYRPTRGPEPTYRRIMRETCRRVFGGSGVRMVASLLASTPPSPSEIEELQRLLDDVRRRGQGEE